MVIIHRYITTCIIKLTKNNGEYELWGWSDGCVTCTRDGPIERQSDARPFQLRILKIVVTVDVYMNILTWTVRGLSGTDIRMRSDRIRALSQPIGEKGRANNLRPLKEPVFHYPTSADPLLSESHFAPISVLWQSAALVRAPNSCIHLISLPLSVHSDSCFTLKMEAAFLPPPTKS